MARQGRARWWLQWRGDKWSGADLLRRDCRRRQRKSVARSTPASRSSPRWCSPGGWVRAVRPPPHRGAGHRRAQHGRRGARRRRGVIFHTDKGSQYTSDAFAAACAKLGGDGRLALGRRRVVLLARSYHAAARRPGRRGGWRDRCRGSGGKVGRRRLRGGGRSCGRGGRGVRPGVGRSGGSHRFGRRRAGIGCRSLGRRRPGVRDRCGAFGRGFTGAWSVGVAVAPSRSQHRCCDQRRDSDSTRDNTPFHNVQDSCSSLSSRAKAGPVASPPVPIVAISIAAVAVGATARAVKR